MLHYQSYESKINKKKKRQEARRGSKVGNLLKVFQNKEVEKEEIPKEEEDRKEYKSYTSIKGDNVCTEERDPIESEMLSVSRDAGFEKEKEGMQRIVPSSPDVRNEILYEQLEQVRMDRLDAVRLKKKMDRTEYSHRHRMDAATMERNDLSLPTEIPTGDVVVNDPRFSVEPAIPEHKRRGEMDEDELLIGSPCGKKVKVTENKNEDDSLVEEEEKENATDNDNLNNVLPKNDHEDNTKDVTKSFLKLSVTLAVLTIGSIILSKAWYRSRK